MYRCPGKMSYLSILVLRQPTPRAELFNHIFNSQTAVCEEDVVQVN